MGYAVVRQINLTDMHCGECDIWFAVPEGWREERQKTGQAFFCPNGHSRGYHETEAMRLKKKLDEALRHNTQLADSVRIAQAARDSADRQRKKAVKELKRIDTRVHAGVCTCCNRTFQNLARHMATKHPAPKEPSDS